MYSKLIFVIFVIWTYGLAAYSNEPKIQISGTQNEEWLKIQKNLQTAKVKFETDQKNLQDLIQKSQTSENIDTNTLDQINEAHSTLKESEKNYKQLEKQYNLRFPEKGLGVGRTYDRVTDKIQNSQDDSGLETVDEKSQDVQTRLKQIIQKIKKQYPQNTVKSHEKTENSSKKTNQQDKVQDTSVTEKIIIKK